MYEFDVVCVDRSICGGLVLLNLVKLLGNVIFTHAGRSSESLPQIVCPAQQRGHVLLALTRTLQTWTCSVVSEALILYTL